MARRLITLDDGQQLLFPGDTPDFIVKRAVDVYFGKRKPDEVTTGDRFNRIAKKTKGSTMEGLGQLSRLLGGEDSGLDLIEGGMQESKIGDMYAPAPIAWDEVGGVGDAFDFVGQNLAETAPQILTPIATTLGGGLVGGPVGAGIGLGAGVTANFPSYIGENTEAQIAAGLTPQETSPGLATGFGAVNAGLDVVTPARAFRLMPGLSSGIGEAALEKVVKDKIGKRIAKRAGEGVLTEGATEGAQQGITLAQAGIANPNLNAMDYVAQNVGQIGDAAITGGVLGGVMGGAGAIVRPNEPQQRARRDVPEQRQREASVLGAGDAGYFDIGGQEVFGRVQDIDPETGTYRVELEDGSIVHLSDSQLRRAAQQASAEPLALTYQPQPLEGEVIRPGPAGLLTDAPFASGQYGTAGIGGISAQQNYEDYVNDLEDQDFQVRQQDQADGMRRMEAREKMAERMPSGRNALPGPAGARPNVQIAGPLGIGSYEQYEGARADEQQRQQFDDQAREEAMFRERTGVEPGNSVTGMPGDEFSARQKMIQDLINLQKNLGKSGIQKNEGKSSEAGTGAAPRAASTKAPELVADKDVDDRNVVETGIRKLTDAGAQLYSVDPAEIKIDPQTYQFKGNTDEKGADDSLKTVKKWNDLLANPVLLHERENGEVYVADGHQRVNLAQRLRADGNGPLTIPAKIIKESDGYTVADARNIGAYMNIANESGTAVDMAKVMRSIERGEADTAKLPPLPMSMSKPKQRMARDLAKLGDNAFGMVANGAVPENYARVVGERMGGMERDGEQTAVLDLLSKGEPKNENEARTMVDLALDSGFDTDTQTGLFGDEQVTNSLFKEKSQIISEALKHLRTAARTFGQLANRAGLIEEEGNVLNLDANQRRSAEEARGAEALTKLATRKGELSDDLNRLAKGLRDGSVSRAAAGRQLSDSAKRFINGEGKSAQPDRGKPDSKPKVEPEDAPALPAKAAEKPAQSDGSQSVIPGAEKIGDKEFAERQMEGKKESTVTQKPADEGLFDMGARNQANLFSVSPNEIPAAANDGAVTLKAMDHVEAPRVAYQIMKNGKWIGTLFGKIVNDGKEFAVNTVAVAKGKNVLGTKAVSSIKRQLMENHPGLETISGTRVSGARKQSGNAADVKMPLRRIKRISDFEVEDAIRAAARQILGSAADKVKIYNQIFGVDPDTGEKLSADGAYVKGEQIIAISLGTPDSPGALRHEAIHFLKDAGLLSDSDWAALTKQAKRWRKKLGIDDRYAKLKLDDAALNEEAIAEAFRMWANGDLPLNSTLEQIMQKIAEFFEAVRLALAGKGITSWEDIFEGIEKGEFAPQVDSAPGFQFSEDPDGVRVVSPGGDEEIYPNMRAAEYGATQQAIDELLIGDADAAKFKLSDKDRDTMERMKNRTMTDNDKSTLQRVNEAVQDAKARGMRDVLGDWRDEFTYGVSDKGLGVLRMYQRALGDDKKHRSYSGYRLFRALGKLSAAMEVSLHYGQLKWDPKEKSVTFDKDKPGLFPSLALAMRDKESRDAFKLYAYARNVTAKNPKIVNGKKVMVSLLDEGKERNMTPQMAKDALALAKNYETELNGKKINAFEKAFDELQSWKKSFTDIAVATGVLPEKEREFWDKVDHIPFHRILDEAESMIARGRTPKLKKFTGGRKLYYVVNQKDGKIAASFTEEAAAKSAMQNMGAGYKVEEGAPLVNDIIENIVHNAVSMLDASVRNAAMQETIRAALANGEAKLVRKSDDFGAKSAEAIRSTMDAMGYDTSTMNDDEVKNLASFLPSSNGNVVSVKINGKPVHYEVEDPFLLKSLNQLNRSIMTMPSVPILTPAKNFLTRVVTLSPGFMARNPIRDSVQSWTQGNDNFTPIIDSLKGLRDATEKNPEIIDLMAHLGDTSIYDTGPEDVNKRLRKIERELSGESEGLTNIVLDWANPVNLISNLEKIGRRTERANRLAVYRRALDAGATKGEAAFEAANMLDFSMRGAWPFVQTLTSIMPFLNAGIQARFRMAQGMAAANPEQRNRFWRRFAALAGMSAALAMINASDDPEDQNSYSAQEQWLKDVAWLIPVGRIKREVFGMEPEEGDINWIAIPKPFELGTMSATMPERIIQRITGNDEGDDTAKSVIRGLTGMLAFNPVSNPVWSLPLSLTSNFDFFKMQPLESKGLQYLAPQDRYYESTSETAKAISRFIGGDVSPIEVDYTIGALLSDLGRTAAYAADQMIYAANPNMPRPPALRAEDKMVLRSFVRNSPPRSTQYKEKIYDLYNETTQLAASMNALKKEGAWERLQEIAQDPRNRALKAVSPQINSVVDKMRDLRKMIRAIDSDTKMSPEEKRKKVDLINKSINAKTALYRKISQQFEQLEETERRRQDE